MGISREKVRDGYLKDLPEPVQKKVFEINKLIVNTVNELLDDKHYQDIKSSRWAMSCIDEFCQKPAGKSECGSVRVYQKGKKYRCMVQITGHFTNHQYGWIEELLHEIIAHTFQNIRPTIRKKYDITIENEGARGAVHEGFDIILPSKESQQIWESLDDRKTKSITESGLLIDDGTGDVILEKKTSIEYSMDRFKKKYNFNPKDSTIIVKGKKFRADLNINSSTQSVTAADGKVFTTGRNLSIYPYGEIPTIFFDKDFFSHLNTAEQDAGLMHEVAHYLMQHAHERDGDSRDKGRNLALKYQTVGGHNNPDEIEADIYSANMTSEKAARRSLEKSARSSIKEGNKARKNGISRFLQSAKYDAKEKEAQSINYRVESFLGLMKSLKLDCENNKESGNTDALNDTLRSMRYHIDINVAGKISLNDILNTNFDDEFSVDLLRIKLRDIYCDKAERDASKRAKEELKKYNQEFIKMRNENLKGEVSRRKALKDPELRSIKAWQKNESYDDSDKYTMSELPYGLQQTIKDLNTEIVESVKEILHSSMSDDQLNERSDHCSINDILSYMSNNWPTSSIGNSSICFNENGIIVGGLIDITPRDIESMFSESIRDVEYVQLIDPITKAMNKTFPKIKKVFESANPERQLIFAADDSGMNPRILMEFDDEYGCKLSNYINHHRQWPLAESSNNTPEYNVDMSESQAIRTLETLCRSMMNSSNKKGINQYNANIFANIITKNLLQKWAKGFNKLSITVKPQQKNALEFVIPTMSQDFVARFIDGRELISGLLHREPEIRINISPRIFDTMKDASDGWKFFKAAVQYYDTGLEKASIDLFAEVRKLDHNMRHLISTTKLSGIITCPMKLLFVFDDIDMHSKDPFKIDQEDIKAVCRFIKGITSNYASPENEQKEIIDAVKSLVKSLQESCEMDDDIRSMTFLSEAVAQLYKGSFNDEIIKSDERFISEQVDYESMRKPRDPNVRYLQEKFGVKKLKKLPVDLVAYITIETESIRDANDKMMIASYCLGKIEIVEWYIELIDVGSKKYVVPHTKPYLDSVRTQLLACYKKIMETPIPKAPGNRPIIDIQYPKGYEG